MTNSGQFHYGKEPLFKMVYHQKMCSSQQLLTTKQPPEKVYTEAWARERAKSAARVMTWQHSWWPYQIHWNKRNKEQTPSQVAFKRERYHWQHHLPWCSQWTQQSQWSWYDCIKVNRGYHRLSQGLQIKQHPNICILTILSISATATQRLNSTRSEFNEANQFHFCNNNNGNL